MSVKLVFNLERCDQAGDDSGFCYCRRNSPSTTPRIKTERKSTIELTGNGPILATIDFGRVPVESSQFHEVTLVSPSGKVPMDISEETNRDVEPIDTAFRLATPAFLPKCGGDRDQRKNSKLTFRIYFEPELPGMHYAQTLDLSIGGSPAIPIQIICRGDSFGPSLCFSENQVNFGGQYYRDETKRRVKLFNLSACEAKFQFDVDNTRSTFKVCPTAGVVPPHTTLKLEITFQAPKPQTYYKRIMLLVLHQQPQFLDLFGVCVPRPFMAPTNGVDFGLSSFQTQFLPLPSQSNQEYFDSDHCWGIHLSSKQIDFDYRDPNLNHLAESEPLSISSNLPYDVVLEWSPDPTEVFLVTPQSAILPAHRSALFQIQFCPTIPNTFYNGELECFAHPTGYNWPTDLGPPWVLTPEETKDKITVIEDTGTRTTKETIDEVVETSSGAPPPTPEHEPPEPILVDTTREAVVQKPPDPISSKDKKEKSVVQKPPDAISSKEKKRKSVIQKPTDRISSKDKIKKSELPKEESHEVTTVENVDEEGEGEDETGSVEQEDIGNGPNEKKSEEEEPKSHFMLSVTISHRNDKPQTFRLFPISESEPEPRPYTVNTFQEIEEGSPTAREMEIDGWQGTEMPQQLGLPLCLTFSVHGHTYLKPPVVTRFRFPKRITMETTWPMNPVCRTVCLKNGSDFPVNFDASSIEVHEIFRLKPNIGVVPGNFHQLVLVSMMPTSPNPLVYVQNTNILLNLKEKNKITLCGMAEAPRIEIIRCYEDHSAETNDGLVFPMTVPNYTSDISIQLVNPTRFYYNFDFSTNELPFQNEVEEYWNPVKIFEPIPSSGVIEPYEFIEIKWTFSPRDLYRYTHIWKCIFNVRRGRVQPREILPHFEWTFPCSGIGESCQIEVFPGILDFGLVELYTKETRTFIVENVGNAVVNLQFKAVHEEWLENFPPGEFKIEPATATIRGHDLLEVSVTIRPYLMNMEKFYISYSLVGATDFQPQFPHICTVMFLGDHPILKVVDIKHVARNPICDGTFSWSMFSLDRFNKLLGGGSIAVVQEGITRPPPTVIFNFPPAPIGSKAAIFTLLLSNKGELGTNWELYGSPPPQLNQFLLDDGFAKFDGNNPTDPSFLGSLWSRRIIDRYKKKAQRVDSDLVREMNVCYNVKPFRDVKFFKVLPSSGQLDSNGAVQISFRYIYKTVGTHDMYYLLRVHPSKFIWIHVKGRTIAINKPFVQHSYDKVVKFIPVALTDMDPPIQHVWMYNGGNVPAKFKINTQTFKRSKVENYGHDVFDLVQTRGIIPPRSWGPIQIRFRPIEIKDYHLLMVAKWTGGQIRLKLHGAPLLRPMTLLAPSELGLIFAERYSLLADPIIPCSISPSHVTLKHFIPTGLMDTTVVFLTNLSERHLISYSWPKNTMISGDGSITFHPREGTLCPNANAACQVVILGGTASIMSTSLIRCTVTDETEAEILYHRTKKWDAYKAFLIAHNISEAEAKARMMKKYGPRPGYYNPCSKVISVTVYVSSAFGTLDQDRTREQMMRPPVPSCKSLSHASNLRLPPFVQQLSRDVLRSVLWDIVHSQGFENFARSEGCWKAPFFQDYVASESFNGSGKPKKKKDTVTAGGDCMEGQGDRDRDPAKHFSNFGSHEILKEFFFDFLADLDDTFKPNDPGTIELKPVVKMQAVRSNYNYSTEALPSPSIEIHEPVV